MSPQQQPNNRIPPTESNQQNHEETAISFLGALKIPVRNYFYWFS